MTATAGGSQKSNGKLYWFGAGSSVMMETDLSGNLQNEYIFFNGQRVARRTASAKRQDDTFLCAKT